MKQHSLPSFFLAAALLTGCTQTLNTHGQILPPSRLAQIQPGITTKDDVVQLLGSPSTTGTMNDQRWYYMTNITKDKPLNPNILQKSDVLVIDFTPSGTVAAVSTKTEKDSKTLEPAANITPTHGQSMGILDQLLGNLGMGAK